MDITSWWKTERKNIGLEFGKKIKAEGGMSIKQLIERLETINKDKEIKIEKLYPQEIISYRGYYEYPAVLLGKTKKTVKDFLNILEKADGQIVYGYKGGEFIINKEQPLFVVYNEGEGICRYIKDVVEYNNKVELHYITYED